MHYKILHCCCFCVLNPDLKNQNPFQYWSSITTTPFGVFCGSDLRFGSCLNAFYYLNAFVEGRYFKSIWRKTTIFPYYYKIFVCRLGSSLQKSYLISTWSLLLDFLWNIEELKFTSLHKIIVKLQGSPPKHKSM